MTAFSESTALQEQQVLVITGIPATLQAVQASWRSVEIPVVLITAQLLVACLLLLFLSVTDAIDARGHEVSLAKLRGRGGWRTIVFGMSEPVLLLAVALPAGVLVGWAATAALCRVLLRPGTAVVLPPLAWATALLATAGGLLAVVLAARRTLRRPVVEEWRRSGRRPAGRGWVVDAVLATGAVAGLLELAVSGQIRLRAPAACSGCSSPGCWAWPWRSSRHGCCHWPAGRLSPGPAPAAASACSSRSGMSPGAPAEPGPRSCSPRPSR